MQPAHVQAQRRKYLAQFVSESYEVRRALAAVERLTTARPDQLNELTAEVTPSSLFGDHMVLQRGMPVPVWGTAEPGEAVTVRFAGRQASTKADARGTWRIDLPALDASAKGREMTIEGANRVVFKDVLDEAVSVIIAGSGIIGVSS